MKYAVACIAGRGRGAKIGLPTLNFRIPADFPYPHGVYAGYVCGTSRGAGAHGEPENARDRKRGARHVAAFHYGPIPTYGSAAPSLEAHVLDDAALSEPFAIELVRYLRPVVRFKNTASLLDQVRKDVETTRETFA